MTYCLKQSEVLKISILYNIYVVSRNPDINCVQDTLCARCCITLHESMQCVGI